VCVCVCVCVCVRVYIVTFITPGAPAPRRSHRRVAAMIAKAELEVGFYNFGLKSGVLDHDAVGSDAVLEADAQGLELGTESGGRQRRSSVKRTLLERKEAYQNCQKSFVSEVKEA